MESPEFSAARLAGALASWDIAPGVAVAAVAEHLAQRHDATLVGTGLRLCDAAPPALPAEVSAAIAPDASGPDLLGEVYQRLLSAQDRHSGGVHYTPRSLADGLVRVLLDDAPIASRVFDPSVGGGVFLLAVARHRHRAGASRVASCDGLGGFDIDPTAIAVAEAALGLWVVAGGETPSSMPGLAVGDALWEPWPECDVVAGNPPFLNQLETSTARPADLRASVRERFGMKVGPYADSAAFFLLMGLDALADHGRMTLVQPVSFLSSSHVEEIRGRLTTAGRMLGLWFTDELLFDASVRVCAPVIERAPAPAPEPVRRWTGATVTDAAAVPHPAARSWGPAVARDMGIPSVVVTSGDGVLGDLASATAGFRDQFYGFADVAVEAEEISPTADADLRPLVTTGMVDPFQCGWGHGEFRFNKQAWRRPAVDLATLAAADDRLDRWTRDRLRPKVVLATQTRIIEVVVDEAGALIPVTPLIAVEPHRDADIWPVAAMLAAPPISALALSERLGSAMVIDAVKLAARQVMALPLPPDAEMWAIGAGHAVAAAAATNETEWHQEMLAMGEAMTRAYRADRAVLDWWSDRLPAYAGWRTQPIPGS